MSNSKNVSDFIYEVRLNQCSKSLLYSNGICCNTLYLNPINNDISTKPLEGYLSGCGCKIKYKAKWKSEKCPLGKW